MTEELLLKNCSRCRVPQVFSNFHRDITKADGCATICKACVGISKKLYYLENKTALNEKDRAYYTAHAAQRIAEARQYREENSKRILQQKKEYYLENVTKISKKAKKDRLSNPELYLLRGAKERAKKAGVPFALSKEDISIPNACPVLGIPLVIGSGSFSNNSPTLDRLVPKLGYVPGNVNVISWRANSVKSDATVEELRIVADWIENSLKKQDTNVL